MKYIAGPEDHTLEQDTSLLEEERLAPALYHCPMMSQEIIGMDQIALNAMDIKMNAMKNMYLPCAALPPQTVVMGCLIFLWRNAMMETKAMMMTVLTLVLSGEI